MLKRLSKRLPRAKIDPGNFTSDKDDGSTPERTIVRSTGQNRRDRQLKRRRPVWCERRRTDRHERCSGRALIGLAGPPAVSVGHCWCARRSLTIGLRRRRRTAPLTQNVSVMMEESLREEGFMRRIFLLAILLIATSIPGVALAQPGIGCRTRTTRRKVACCNAGRDPGPVGSEHLTER